MTIRLAVLLVLIGGSVVRAEEPRGYRAGIAVRIITPKEPLWMAGYASRTKPAESKLHDIRLKALALEDPAGTKLVLVTSDLIAIPANLGKAAADAFSQQTGLPRERLMLSASHTHCGPVVNESLMDMYPLSAEQKEAVVRYTGWLQETIVSAAKEALADMKPVKLSVGSGAATFAINRREAKPNGIVIGRNPGGPVDHSVPVLRVESPDGKLRAIAFGYACHNTTLDGYSWSGDYAGYAQYQLEASHPGAVAMFWTGCGADANPDPRRTVELAEKHGKSLADAVDAALAVKLQPVSGAFSAAFAAIPLELTATPDRATLQADILSKDHAVRQRATRFLKTLDGGNALPTSYPAYPVQVWKLGDGPVWVALGGEVVVDYALRLKNELAGNRPVWVMGYANDVMAYIPSERVLKEGGYEADRSMVYYGMAGRWAPGLEDKIVGKARELASNLEKR